MTAVTLSSAKHSLLVRQLSVEDCPSVMAIERLAHSHPWSEKIMLQSLAKHRGWGVYDGKILQGFAIVSQVLDEAELLDCVVSPKVQGQGVGSLFVEWLVTEVGSKAARFYLEVRESNQPAIALYEKCGFVEMGVRTGYYPAAKGREDAILMAMELF